MTTQQNIFKKYQKIQNEKELDYVLIEREDFIDDLIRWIAEVKSQSDKKLMKDDLVYLIKLNDEFILSSINTNEYLALSVEKEVFMEVINEQVA